MWVTMAGLVILGLVLSNVFHFGALVLLLLICPLMMLLMMALMGNMGGHGSDKH